jgi:hypothetical protein
MIRTSLAVGNVRGSQKKVETNESVPPHKIGVPRLTHNVVKMKFLVFAAALATATAFTIQPSAFSSVGERGLSNVFDSSAHRTRRATIVMDGKANGMFYVIFILIFSLTYVYRTSRVFNEIRDHEGVLCTCRRCSPCPTKTMQVLECMSGERGNEQGKGEPAKSLFSLRERVVVSEKCVSKRGFLRRL